MSLTLSGTTGIVNSNMASNSVNGGNIVDGSVTDSKLNLSVKPMFSAYLSTTQSVTSSTPTKCTINTKEFDSTNAYDNITNYRFQPLKAGKYQVSAQIGVATTNTLTNTFIAIYKNGSLFKRGTTVQLPSAVSNTNANISIIVDMNGSTDYLEVYGYVTATAAVFTGGADYTYFQAHYIGA